MEIYCVSCQKDTANENSSVKKSKQKRLMVLSNWAFSGKKTSILLKIENLIIFQMISLK